jgi:hypothetical protein
MFTRQPDFMIGNSYGKFIQRDTLAKGEARRGIEHFLHRFLPAFIGVMAEDHRRLAAQLQQEAGR